MKARYVIGCTIITLLSVVALANYYYETAPVISKSDTLKLVQSETSKKTNISGLQRKPQVDTSAPVSTTIPVNNKSDRSTNDQERQDLYTVTRTAHQDDHIYRSTITPVVKNIITSPVNGQLDGQARRYGDHLKKGDKVVGIISEEARNQLLSDTVNYISNRDSFYLSESEDKKSCDGFG